MQRTDRILPITLDEIERRFKAGTYVWMRVYRIIQMVWGLNPDVTVKPFEWGDGAVVDFEVTLRRKYRFIARLLPERKVIQWLRWRPKTNEWQPARFLRRWWIQHTEIDRHFIRHTRAAKLRRSKLRSQPEVPNDSA